MEEIYLERRLLGREKARFPFNLEFQFRLYVAFFFKNVSILKPCLKNKLISFCITYFQSNSSNRLKHMPFKKEVTKWRNF
jgi:hypothetical protein